MANYQRGDYFVVRTRGLFAWLIRLVTRSEYNHAGIITDNYGNTIEAQAKGAVLGNLAKYKGEKMAFSHMDLDAMRRAMITSQAFHLLGRPYGIADLIWLGLLQYHMRYKFVERSVERTDDLVCSQVVAFCYKAAGIRLCKEGTLWLDVTPGDLARLI